MSNRKQETEMLRNLIAKITKVTIAQKYNVSKNTVQIYKKYLEYGNVNLCGQGLKRNVRR